MSRTKADKIGLIMAQAQVFASSWSLVGGRFDYGDALGHAETMKEDLRTMIEYFLPMED